MNLLIFATLTTNARPWKKPLLMSVGKVEVVTALFLTEHRAMKAYWGMEL
jgi:hypothetical protein